MATQVKSYHNDGRQVIGPDQTALEYSCDTFTEALAVAKYWEALTPQCYVIIDNGTQKLGIGAMYVASAIASGALTYL
jgi:hypothetical protein